MLLYSITQHRKELFSNCNLDLLPCNRRLLSSLPPADTFTPLSAEAQLREIQEFGVWIEVWGGDMRAWSMAQTLQKLKDGLRRGTKEVIWQQ